MNKRLWVFLYIMLLILVFSSGCQLAIRDKGDIEAESAARGDLLRGFYITFESVPSSKVTDPVKAPDNNNRIYAAERKSDEHGEETTRYVFEGIEGIPFFLASVHIEGCDDKQLVTINDNHIADVHINVGESMELTGKLYLSTRFNRILYFYPVFQTPDGRIYLDAAGGEGLGGMHGASARYALESKTTITENGEKQEKSNKVEVLIEFMHSLEKVVFKEMNNRDEMLTVIEVTKGQNPEPVYLKEDTAYILVEEHGTDAKGEAVVTRTLLERDKYGFDIYFLCRFMDDVGVAEGFYITFKH